MAGGSGSGKANALINLINNEPDIDKIYIYAKEPYAAKYQLVINKRERACLKYLYDSKTFIDTQMMIFIKMLKNTIQKKLQKLLIVFDYMIVDSNKKPNPRVTAFFIR